MNTTTLPRSRRKNIPDEKAVIAAMFAEISRLNQQMRQDQVDIDHLKIETDALSAETLQLKFETRSILVLLGVTL